jgi:hypothetical protein
MHNPIESGGSSSSGDNMTLLLGYPEILATFPEEHRREALTGIYSSLAESDAAAVDNLTLALARNPDPELRRLAIDGVKLGYSSRETSYETITILIADVDPSVADVAYRYEVDRELRELGDTILNSVEVLDSDRMPSLAHDDAITGALAEIATSRHELVDGLKPDWSNLNDLLDFIVGQEAIAAERILASETRDAAITGIKRTVVDLRDYMESNNLLSRPPEADG